MVDSDLIPEPLQVPFETNALWGLAEATNTLYWPEASEDTLNNLINDREWDDSLAAEVLEKNRVCLDWFERSFQRQFLFPQLQAGADEATPYLGSLRAIARLECLRTAKLFHERKEKEAFDLALKVTTFGHRLENAGGTSIHFLVGGAVKSLGLRRLQLMTAHTSVPESDLIGLIQALSKLGVNEPGLTNALKAEYQAECKILEDSAAGNWKSVGLTNSPSEQVVISNQLKRVFSVDKTRLQLARTTRALLVNIPAPFAQAEWPQFSQEKTIAKAWLQWGWLRKHNVTGEQMFYMQVGQLKKLFERKSRENVHVRATQLLLALKVFEGRHHRLPATLTELTPEFFPKLPLDDFDGQPLRYRPDLKLIYSVGPDLKDSEGKKSPGGDDLPFKIPF